MEMLSHRIALSTTVSSLWSSPHYWGSTLLYERNKNLHQELGLAFLLLAKLSVI